MDDRGPQPPGRGVALGRRLRLLADPDPQREASGEDRLAASGEKVRVYVPYGPQWYPYLVRRMAEKPANLALFVRALAGRG